MSVYEEEDLFKFDILKNELGLNVSEDDCLKRHYASAMAMFDFYMGNNKSEAAKAFSKEAVTVICNDGEVDFDERIIYDKDLLDCQKTVLNDLKNNTESRISEIINDFSGDKPDSRNYVWKVKTGNLGFTGKHAETIFYGNLAETIMNNDVMNDATDIKVAATLIHEAIHAWLGFHFNQADPNNIYEEYEEYYNAYINEEATANNIGHDVMADTFRNRIKNALKEYGASKGYTIDDFTYEALAWGGLTEKKDANGSLIVHPKFIEYVPDSNIRSQILNVNHAETHNQTGFGNAIPKGQQVCN